MENVKYPDIEVQLTGNDGNAFAILGSVGSALKQHGLGNDVVDQFMEEATAGDYDELLQTCMEWVTVL